METEFPLEELFLHLVHRRGFALTVRDYQDALRALRLGYGTGSRDLLLRLLEVLWARNEEEIRDLNLVFRGIPFPTIKEIAAWTGTEKPDPGGGPGRPREEHQGAGETAPPVPQLQFADPRQGGIGLPRAQVGPSGREPFILQPRPPMSQRAMIVTWRRFRRALRTGPKVELDMAATVLEQSRRGILTAPVLVPARRNLARLIVLVDAGPAMAAWRTLSPAIAESLLEGHLGLGMLYFFHEIPGERLYERDNLTHPVRLDHLLERHGASSLLIVSDAGAAQGLRDQERIGETRRFLEQVADLWRPVAWANPLPRKRWKGTPAERIALLPHVAMTELSEDGLVKAIDVLRGHRSA